jgi:hypothetical protein
VAGANKPFEQEKQLLLTSAPRRFRIEVQGPHRRMLILARAPGAVEPAGGSFSKG